MLPIGDVTKNLLIINILMFLLRFVLSPEVYNSLALYFPLSENFRPYQLITHFFMHANISHIVFNMFALVMIGTILEQTWGAKKYLFYYIFCAFTAAIAQNLYYYFAYSEYGFESLNFSMLGASGAISGVVLAIALLYPNMEFMLFPIPIPIKAKYLIPISIAIEIYLVMFPSPNDNVAHFAHLGGALGGFLLIQYWRKFGSNFN